MRYRESCLSKQSLRGSGNPRPASRGFRHLLRCHICLNVASYKTKTVTSVEALVSHRQRQRLLIEFANELGMTRVRSEKVSYVLRHRNASRCGFLLDCVRDDPIGSGQKFHPVTFAWSRHNGSVPGSPLYLIHDTP
jgi:hypothetical protein